MEMSEVCSINKEITERGNTGILAEAVTYIFTRDFTVLANSPRIWLVPLPQPHV